MSRVQPTPGSAKAGGQETAQPDAERRLPVPDAVLLVSALSLVLWILIGIGLVWLMA